MENRGKPETLFKMTRTLRTVLVAAIAALSVGCRATEPIVQPSIDESSLLAAWHIRFIQAFIGTDNPCYAGGPAPGCRHDTLGVQTAIGDLTISALYDSLVTVNGPVRIRWARATGQLSAMEYNYPLSGQYCSGKPVTECWHPWLPGSGRLMQPPVLQFHGDSVLIELMFTDSNAVGGGYPFALTGNSIKLPASRWYDSSKYGVLEIWR